MILAANQITFIPWIGFFDLIRCSDVWVTLDTFQMPDRSFISRNRVKYDDNNIRWISIPLKAYKSQTQINEIQIIQDKWWKKIINRLSNYYSKAKYFRVVHSLVEHILPPHENYLVDYNERVLRNLCTIVNIQFSPIRLSNLTMEHSCGTDATDNLLVALCKKFGADCYYNFRCGVDEGMHKCENYASNGIKLYKQAFNHLEYQQCGEKFISHMSILDALYNVGPEETKNLIITGSGWEYVRPLMLMSPNAKWGGGQNFQFRNLLKTIVLQQLKSLEQWWPACTDVDGFHAQERAKYDYLRLVIFDLEAGVFLLYAGCLCGECDDFATLIARQGIQASADYQSLFTVPYFRNNIYDFPTSEFYGRRYVILSCGSDETEEGLEYIIQATKKW